MKKIYLLSVPVLILFSLSPLKTTSRSSLQELLNDSLFFDKEEISSLSWRE